MILNQELETAYREVRQKKKKDQLQTRKAEENASKQEDEKEAQQLLQELEDRP